MNWLNHVNLLPLCCPLRLEWYPKYQACFGNSVFTAEQKAKWKRRHEKIVWDKKVNLHITTLAKKIRGEITREMKKQISCVWFRNQYQGGFEIFPSNMSNISESFRFCLQFFAPVINRYSNDFHGTSGMTSSLKSCNSLKEFKINMRDGNEIVIGGLFASYRISMLQFRRANPNACKQTRLECRQWFMFSLFSSSIESLEKISSKFDNFSLRTGFQQKADFYLLSASTTSNQRPVKLLLMIAENSKSWDFLIDNW